MARTTNAVKHTHQYWKVNGLWFCSGIDGCTHYMPKNMPPPVGRLSLCWGCKKEFQLTPMSMEETKPLCDACVEQQDNIGSWLEEKMGRTEKPTGLTAFGARPSNPPVKTMDEIEVIDDEGGHSPDCGIYDNLDCTCK